MGQHRGTHPGRTNAPAHGATPSQARTSQNRGHTPAARKTATHVPTAEEIASDTAATLLNTVSGRFDREKLHSAFDGLKQTHYKGLNKVATLVNIEQVLGYMENDATVTDLRWMAYMLATAFWEDGKTRDEKVAVIDRKTGKPKIDKATNKPVEKTISRYVSVQPIDEAGHGHSKNRKGKDVYLPYYLPVKVKSLTDGKVQITECDGDQFVVEPVKGTFTLNNKSAKRGVKNYAGEPLATFSDDLYKTDTGTEHAYFGRGYVQLTWWDNYAAAGIGIGLGMKLLLDPDMTYAPEIAYKVMSWGMVTGGAFANRFKLSDFIRGRTCNYVAARKMVNGSDHNVEIATIAKQFETMLLNAKPQ